MPSTQKIVLWIVGFILLVTLADYYPTFAKGFAGLLLASVVLINYKTYGDIFTGAVGTATGKPTQTTS